MPSIEFTVGEVRAVASLYQQFDGRPSRDLAQAMDKVFVVLEEAQRHPAGCICFFCVAQREAR